MCIRILTLALCICPHRDTPSLCPHAANLRLSPSEILDEPFTPQGWTTRLPTVLQGHIDWKFSEDQTQWEHCPAYKARNRFPSDQGGNGNKIVSGREDSCPQTQELAGKLEGQWTRVVRRLCEECQNGHGVGVCGLVPQQQEQQQQEMSEVAKGKQAVGLMAAVGLRRAATGRRASMIPTAGGRDRLSIASKTIGVRSDESWIRSDGSRGRVLAQRKTNHFDGNGSTSFSQRGGSIRENGMSGASNGERALKLSLPKLEPTTSPFEGRGSRPTSLGTTGRIRVAAYRCTTHKLIQLLKTLHEDDTYILLLLPDWQRPGATFAAPAGSVNIK
ncbi:hypothetical protein B0T21DRAFT_416242 [Apiosordaria backusii]|uniref:Uncharacterized protein n=1 Tax=Apiosordaria backusii TaxID=314023 RepID=A0AA40A4A1_9PEZI|nr:hypothetical protein B0T21DRAFT_416242 [Apiosordaria backusii]